MVISGWSKACISFAYNLDKQEHFLCREDVRSSVPDLRGKNACDSSVLHSVIYEYCTRNSKTKIFILLTKIIASDNIDAPLLDSRVIMLTCPLDDYILKPTVSLISNNICTSVSMTVILVLKIVPTRVWKLSSVPNSWSHLHSCIGLVLTTSNTARLGATARIRYRIVSSLLFLVWRRRNILTMEDVEIDSMTIHIRTQIPINSS